MKYLKRYNENIEWDFDDEEIDESIPFLILNSSIMFIYNNKICFLVSINEDKDLFDLNSIKEIYINNNKILFISIQDIVNKFLIELILSSPEYKIHGNPQLYSNGYIKDNKRYFSLDDIKDLSNNIIINNDKVDDKDIIDFFNKNLNESIEWKFEEEEIDDSNIEKIRNTFIWEAGGSKGEKKLLKNISNNHLINLIKFIRITGYGRYGKTNSELLDIFQKELDYRKLKRINVK